MGTELDDSEEMNGWCVNHTSHVVCSQKEFIFPLELFSDSLVFVELDSRLRLDVSHHTNNSIYICSSII